MSYQYSMIPQSPALAYAYFALFHLFFIFSFTNPRLSAILFPSGVPRRSKVRFASTFFMQKTSSARSLASPSQIEPTALGFDLVKGANLKALASIVLGYSKLG